MDFLPCLLTGGVKRSKSNSSTSGCTVQWLSLNSTWHKESASERNPGQVNDSLSEQTKEGMWQKSWWSAGRGGKMSEWQKQPEEEKSLTSLQDRRSTMPAQPPAHTLSLCHYSSLFHVTLCAAASSKVLTDYYRLWLPWQYVVFFQTRLLAMSVMWTKAKTKQKPFDHCFSAPVFARVMHYASITSNAPITKTLLNVVWCEFFLQGLKAPLTPFLSSVLYFYLVFVLLLMGLWRVWLVVWRVPGPVCVCGQACVRVLYIQIPSVWWPDTVWESVCRRRIHTQHKGPIMSPHSKKQKGGGRGDNRGLSILEGGIAVPLPLTSLRLSSLPHHKQICVNRNRAGRKFL